MPMDINFGRVRISNYEFLSVPLLDPFTAWTCMAPKIF